MTETNHVVVTTRSASTSTAQVVCASSKQKYSRIQSRRRLGYFYTWREVATNRLVKRVDVDWICEGVTVGYKCGTYVDVILIVVKHRLPVRCRKHVLTSSEAASLLFQVMTIYSYIRNCMWFTI